jgi:hypothetical protein
MSSLTMRGWSYAIATEYNFQELPELGFNREFAYDFLSMDADDEELDLNGIHVTMGVHYRF